MNKRPSANGDNGNGRDAGGRFARGNAGGPGNPYARRVARLRSVLLNKVGDDELAEVVDGLLQAAKGGDVAAARLLLSYTIGKPADAVDPDRVELDETRLDMERRSVQEAEELSRLLG